MRWITLAIVLPSIGCGSGEDPRPLCDDLVPSATEVDAAVILGLGGFETFEPIEDGATLELELGTQGGWMVRPVARFDAAPLGADPERCVWVESIAVIDGTAEPIALTQVPTFEYSEGVAVSSPLLVLLSFDLEAVEGQRATIDVRVEGPGAASTATIDVELVNLE